MRICIVYARGQFHAIQIHIEWICIYLFDTLEENRVVLIGFLKKTSHCVPIFWIARD